MSIFSVIKFDGLKNRDWIVYKFPSEDIVIGSQLIVQEGQTAIFVKGGTVCDIFYPGTYTLSTNNIPILCSIINIPFGRTPFSAEIYFINTTTKLDIFWGTSDPIQIIDPNYFVKLRIRAYGQMGIKLLDYQNFFKELIGGMNKADCIKFEKVKEFYKGLIVLKVKSIIAETIINEKISALEISTQLENISNRTKARLEIEFMRFGLTVVNFYVQSINFPDEDFDKINKILNDKAAFEIMGDSRYMTKRTLDVYEGAANNQSGIAGAFAAGGIGIGMGINLAENLKNEGMILDIKKHCPQCGTENLPNNKFCSTCGYNLQERHCQCGESILPGMRFCSKCGKKVE